jgi:hypothetical protein
LWEDTFGSQTLNHPLGCTYYQKKGRGRERGRGREGEGEERGRREERERQKGEGEKKDILKVTVIVAVEPDWESLAEAKVGPSHIRSGSPYAMLRTATDNYQINKNQ